MPRSRVLGMGMDTGFEAAEADVGAACRALTAMQQTPFTGVLDHELLPLARSFEHASRLMFAAQVHIAGEIDIRRIADAHGCSSSAALLRQTLVISAADARARVHAGRAVLPQESPTGEIEPTLPVLAEALAAGAIGSEQTRTIVTTMRKLPAAVDPDTRELCQKLLVQNGVITEPKPFADFARAVALACDPDGKLEGKEPAEKVELTVGVRNAGTGLTGFTGRLDDLGVELLGQAIDGLAKPQPSPDGTPDPRSAAVRRGQAFKEVLRRFLDHGDAPTHGGERPHVTVTVDLEDLRAGLAGATLEHGGPIGAAEARMLACDADIIPMVMGSKSEVLDVGRANRLFTPAIRKAITKRDRGCAFPGCDRPAAWTDCHRVKHWADGGKTCYENCCLLCRFHHSEVHKGHWVIQFAADGVPEFIPPSWVDPDRKPRRNNAHHITDMLRV